MAHFNVKVGDTVRSFDFPHLGKDLDGVSSFYVEGEVVAIHMAGVDNVTPNPVYEVKVSRKVVEGKDMSPLPYDTCYPPLNGLRNWLGGITDAVEVI